MPMEIKIQSAERDRNALFSIAASETSVGYQRLVAICVLAIATSYVVDAPLRYALSFARLEQILYARDLAAVALVMVEFVRWILGRKSSFVVVAVCYLLALHFILGAFNLPSILQPIVGLKVFLSFLLGLCAAEHLVKYSDRLAGWAILALIICTGGVIGNYFIAFPWEGQMIASALGERALSREWTAGGIKRLAGFSRASFDAAAVLLVLVVPAVIALRRYWYLQITALGLVAYSIWLTTSKGALLALVLFSVLYLFQFVLAWRRVAMVLLGFVLASSVLLPFLGVFFGFAPEIRGSDTAWWLSSFVARLQQMWPDALLNVTQHGSVVLGRGLGGIGFPQLFGEWFRYNAADNVAIYFFSNFGVLGILYLVVIAWYGIRAVSSSGEPLLVSSVGGWLIVFLGYGLTLNMIEQPFSSMTFGFVGGVGLLVARARRLHESKVDSCL